MLVHGIFYKIKVMYFCGWHKRYNLWPQHYDNVEAVSTCWLIIFYTMCLNLYDIYLAPHRGRARYCNAHVCLCVCVFVRVFAKFQSVISQPFLNRSRWNLVHTLVARRARSAISDCLVVTVVILWYVLSYIEIISDYKHGYSIHRDNTV